MTFWTSIVTKQRGLPQLRGGLLAAYRALWLLAALATVAVLATTLFNGTMQPLVLGIRIAKSMILIAISSILFWKRPRDPVAAVLGLAFLCWTITSSVDFTSGAVAANVLDRLRFLLFALALLLFPDGQWRPQWTRHIAVASILVFVIGVAETVDLLPTRFFLPLAIACVLAAIFSLILRFRSSSCETQQQQLKWVSFGLVTGVSLILSARASAALSGSSLVFEAMFQLGIVLVALGFLVPLLRYRLYDAETVISRSVGYAVLTTALVATFAGSQALIELLGEKYLGSGIGDVSGASAAALAAVLLAPLNDRIGSWAEERFQRDLVRLKAHVPELLNEIPPGWSPSQIGKRVLPLVTDAIHATSAAIIIDGKVVAATAVTARQASQSRAQFPLQLPLRYHSAQSSGVLLIGPRPDGSSYGREDREAVDAVLPALSRAVLASSEHQRDRQRSQDFQRGVRSKLREITTRLAQLEAEHRRCDGCLR